MTMGEGGVLRMTVRGDAQNDDWRGEGGGRMTMGEGGSLHFSPTPKGFDRDSERVRPLNYL